MDHPSLVDHSDSASNDEDYIQQFGENGYEMNPCVSCEKLVSILEIYGCDICDADLCYDCCKNQERPCHKCKSVNVKPAKA